MSSTAMPYSGLALTKHCKTALNKPIGQFRPKQNNTQCVRLYMSHVNILQKSFFAC